MKNITFWEGWDTFWSIFDDPMHFAGFAGWFVGFCLFEALANISWMIIITLLRALL